MFVLIFSRCNKMSTNKLLLSSFCFHLKALDLSDSKALDLSDLQHRKLSLSLEKWNNLSYFHLYFSINCHKMM